ncbi:hypothetical protein GJ496_000274 [Pomphorhynchus laevis]|nr:hypothetical protein GJ496_000274 [Pomphorhynchus laevis]
MKNSRVTEVGNFKKLIPNLSRLVKDGQTSRARILLNCDTTVEGIHSTSDIVGDKSVLSILEELHLSSSNAAERVILKSPIEGSMLHHSIVFDEIDASSIISAASSTKGAADPSGVNARAWYRMPTSFGSESYNLTECLAKLGRRLARKKTR